MEEKVLDGWIYLKMCIMQKLLDLYARPISDPGQIGVTRERYSILQISAVHLTSAPAFPLI
jgi:hypothetical protein